MYRNLAKCSFEGLFILFTFSYYTYCPSHLDKKFRHAAKIAHNGRRFISTFFHLNFKSGCYSIKNMIRC